MNPNPEKERSKCIRFQGQTELAKIVGPLLTDLLLRALQKSAKYINEIAGSISHQTDIFALCLQLTSYPATMSYGDYNPDEVSDKFQDGLNLEGQGQGGGYGGGDYEGTAAIDA